METQTPRPGLLQRAMILGRLAVQTSPLRHQFISGRHKGLREADMFLASYPKCGNTWLRHLVTNIVTGKSTPWRGGLDEVCRLVGKHEGLPEVARDNGRLIKTHEPYRDEYRRGVLLVRDARDVVVSEFFYQKSYSKYFFVYNDSFEVFVDRFLDGKVNGYGNWPDHINGWMDGVQNEGNQILVLHFEKLKSDTFGSLRNVVDHLGLVADDDELRRAIEDCSVDSMKRKEREYWESQGQPNKSFVRAAKSGGWRDHFTSKLEEKFWQRAGSAMERLGYQREKIASANGAAS